MEQAIIFKSNEKITNCVDCPFRHFETNIEFLEIDNNKMSFTSEIKRESAVCWVGETNKEIEYPINFGSVNCPIQKLKKQDDLSYTKDY